MAGMVMTNRNPKSHLTQRRSSVWARKKNKGSVISNASPKSLLSAIIEPFGPYNRNCPIVRIMKGKALRTRTPKQPAITSTKVLSLEKLFTTDTETAVINKTLETYVHLSH